MLSHFARTSGSQTAQFPRASVEIFRNTENWKSPVALREMESSFKTVQTKKSPGADSLTSEFFQMLGEINNMALNRNFSETRKRGRIS